MKKSFCLAFLSLTAMLTACSRNTALLDNPLYIERYADEIVDRMVELKIQNDPLLEDPSKASAADEARVEWLRRAQEANQKQKEGMNGSFIGMGEFATGEALYVDNMLFFSTKFETVPGPDLHVHLTTVVDPRDVEFPDKTDFDLGALQTPYGAQQYEVPKVEDSQLYRTAVIWDNTLGRLYGFAQMGRQL